MATFALGASAGIYASALAYLYFKQDKLVFESSKKHPLQRLFLEKYGHRTTEYTIENENMPTLRGWYVNREQSTAIDTLVIYFGGNAENIDTVMFLASNIPHVDMVSLHYRGYGLSDGKPSEESLYLDALRIVDHFKAKYPEKKIVLFGRSLGTGVAMYAAAHRPGAITRVILTTPYDSLASVAKRHYSWVPIKSLLKHQFDILSFAHDITVPIHIIVAGQDDYIPLEHALKLKEALINTHVEWDVVEKADHVNIHDWNRTWELINTSLGRVNEDQSTHW